MKKLILITTALVLTSLAAHASCPFSGDRKQNTAVKQVASILGGKGSSQQGTK